MPITTLPALDRTSVTFRADVDTFFGSQLPGFAAEANALQTDVNAKQATTTTKAAEAAASATAAAASSTKAGQWADANENVTVETGKYSAKHHAIKAAASATSASGAATTATTKAAEAAASAATAASEVQAAAASAVSAAEASANAAAASASNAASSATNAASSAQVALDAAASIADGPVTSVNGQTGVVTLTAADVGAEPADASIVKAAAVQTLYNKTLEGAVHTGVIDQTGSVRANVVALAANTLNCSLGNYFTRTISANSTFAFSNVPASRAYSCTLELTHTGGTVTWPASVKWPNDTAPTLTTGKTHIFIFVTDDGGARWRGAALTNYTN